MDTNTTLKHDDDSFLKVQYANDHMGIIRKVNDPEGRGRVRVEVPGIRGLGEDNWTDWIEVAGMPFGGSKGKGDYGIWWPMQAGQRVMVGYLAGDNTTHYAMPCNTFQDGNGKQKQWMPKDAKASNKESGVSETRVFMLKTPSGASLLFNDNAGKESVQLTDWMGQGLRIDSKSKGQDKQEDAEKGESSVRTENCRGCKSTWQKNPYKPSDTKDGRPVISLVDVNGSGFTIDATQNGSVIQIKAVKSHGAAGPMITLDSIDNMIILQAGKAQAVLNGNKNQWETTYSVIQEKQFMKKPEEYQNAIETTMKQWSVADTLTDA